MCSEDCRKIELPGRQLVLAGRMQEEKLQMQLLFLHTLLVLYLKYELIEGTAVIIVRI